MSLDFFQFQSTPCLLMHLLTTLPLILAANMWEIAIGGILFFFYIAGQLMSLRGEAKPKPVRRQPAPDPPLVEPAVLLDDERIQPPRPPADQAESLRSEIEDFVRRAQGKAPQQEPPVRQHRPLRPSGQKRAQPKTSLPPVSQTPTSQPSLRTEGVAEHVSKHISSSSVAQHAEELGTDLGQTDERMESRLHEKFDRQVGSLEHRKTPEKKKEPQGDVTAELAELLSRPEGMRQLIIANEILRRPEW